jgi:16S rRNA (adenine1518-N6/adenine1519-N6)-dimethyltransferase
MKLSEMRRILSEKGIRLTKSLGQNFLFDANQLRRIIALADLNARDKVLEIGPGLGPLTELLVAAAGEVLAIEKDARLVQLLQERFSNLAPERLRLVHDDALGFLKREERQWSEWKLLSNLPYSIASPLLVELALKPSGPQRIVVTLQAEVANRLAASPGTPDYGVLTLLIQLNYEPRDSFKIPASCFFPEPEIDSMCVCLARRQSPLLSEELVPRFCAIVKRSFSQRRKMMLKLLKSDWPEAALQHAFSNEKLSPQVRAEQVTLRQFIGLTKCLNLPFM